jgi:hypothetical protein
MPTRMELPDNLTGHVARALLQLKHEGRFTLETLNVNSAGASMVCRDLEMLNWPVKPVAGAKPETYELRPGSDREAALRRMQTRAFLEWESEVAAKLAGLPPPEKPARAAASNVWSANDYTGLRGAPLSHPSSTSSEYQLFFALIHLEHVTPDIAQLGPLCFIAAAQSLADSGWPVELERTPLAAKFSDSVPSAVIDAWRDAFGNRGRQEALQGTLGAVAVATRR